ncbi:MAG: TRAP transporter small permease subunit [Sphaerochaetaceae bacterium]|nr:TRAP transporter small permease subunit [Sphaerochaetaceae bacterium]
MKVLRLIDTALAKILKVVGLACFVGLFVILMANVFFRWIPLLKNLPNFSMGWFDELVEMLFAWMIMTTASILCRDKAHFTVDLLQMKFKEIRWINILNMFCDIVSLIFLIALCYYSMVLMMGARQLTQEMHIQKRWFYLCMPLNSFIMSCYTLRDLIVDCEKFVCFRKKTV